MGKRNRKVKAAAAAAEPGVVVMPRPIMRQTLETVKVLSDRCVHAFGFQSRKGDEWNDFCEVYEIVQQLRAQQQNYVIPGSSRKDHMNEFLSWMEANGTDITAVGIASFEDEGYGLVAKRNINMSETFLEVPRKTMITTETATLSELAPLLESDQILKQMPNVLLALHLLCEKKRDDSFWKPYIDILPNEYNTPLYFTPNEVLMLRGSPGYSEAINQFRNITRQYSYFFKLFQDYIDADKIPIRYFCFDDYRWAVSTIMTRQNQIPSITQSKITALIPLWDMCNHKDGYLTTDFSVEKDCSVCYAQSHFDEGEQIYIFYGPRANSEFLVHSGFVYNPNTNDKLAIKLGIGRTDSLYKEKTQLLAKCSPSLEYYLHAEPEPIDSELLLFLRIFCMTKEELEVRLEDGYKTGKLRDWDTCVSLDNDLKVWIYIKTRAQLLLRTYPTTSEDDKARLQESGLSERQKNAVLLIMGEKRILQFTEEYSQKFIKEFESAKEAASKESNTSSKNANKGILVNGQSPAKNVLSQLPAPALAANEDELIDEIENISLL